MHLPPLLSLLCFQAQGDPASPDPLAATSRHVKELRGLIASLDSLLPYLNLAISAAGLLASGEPRCSYINCVQPIGRPPLWLSTGCREGYHRGDASGLWAGVVNLRSRTRHKAYI
jgi:hypothetical protein